MSIVIFQLLFFIFATNLQKYAEKDHIGTVTKRLQIIISVKKKGSLP